MRYKCPECGSVWTEGAWTEYPIDRYCSDGCRRRAREAEEARREAERPRHKCSWCGSIYYAGEGYVDSAGNYYCSHKCFRDAGNDPGVQAERRTAEEAERRKQEAEERRRREAAAERARKEAEERARKADPSRWYPQEWVDYLKTNPGSAGRCPWSRLRIEHRMWASLLKSQPQLWNYCHGWNGFDGEDWDRCMDGLLRQTGFKSGVETKLNSAGWAILLTKSTDYDAKCPWSRLTASDWAYLLRYRSDLAGTCPRENWKRFSSGDWCTLLSKNPGYWLRAWRCDWFSVSDENWAKLPFYTKPLEVFMFFANMIDRFLNGVGGLIVLAALLLIVLAIVL